jgi:hypothetical protein
MTPVAEPRSGLAQAPPGSGGSVPKAEAEIDEGNSYHNARSCCISLFLLSYPNTNPSIINSRAQDSNPQNRHNEPFFFFFNKIKYQDDGGAVQFMATSIAVKKLIK